LIEYLAGIDEVLELLVRYLRKAPIVVLGIGNELRRDDGFGSYLARSLSKYVSRYMKLKDVHIIDAGNAPELYTDVLRKASNGSVIFIDSIWSGGRRPGDIVAFVITLNEGDLPQQKVHFVTTHTLDIKMVLRAAGIPEALTLGVVPSSIDFGIGLTKPVAEAFTLLFTAFTRFFMKLETKSLPFSY